MIESLERHLVSDVPVGIFLSGGIDSTAILALTREVLGPKADIRTFSIGFEEVAFDESAPARRTAECFGACHTEWKMTTEDGAAEIPAFLEAMDQPTNDGFNTWCVSKLARREGVKVVLSGLGGDEIFAGYPSFGRVPQFRTWHERLGPWRSLAALVLKAWPAGTPHQRLAASAEKDDGDDADRKGWQTGRGATTKRGNPRRAPKGSSGGSGGGSGIGADRPRG